MNTLIVDLALFVYFFKFFGFFWIFFLFTHWYYEVKRDVSIENKKLKAKGMAPSQKVDLGSVYHSIRFVALGGIFSSFLELFTRHLRLSNKLEFLQMLDSWIWHIRNIPLTIALLYLAYIMTGRYFNTKSK